MAPRGICTNRMVGFARRTGFGSGTCLLLACLLSPPAMAQTTCYTDPEGTTLCSTPEGVITGSTNAVGDSTYRDDRGNELELEADAFGGSSLQLPSGKAIQWYPSAPAARDALPGQAGPSRLGAPLSPGVPAGIYPLPGTGQPYDR